MAPAVGSGPMAVLPAVSSHAGGLCLGGSGGREEPATLGRDTEYLMDGERHCWKLFVSPEWI